MAAGPAVGAANRSTLFYRYQSKLSSNDAPLAAGRPALLVLLRLPFLSVKWNHGRQVLPPGRQARQVGIMHLR